MRRLTLLRHAKSSWGDPQLSDFDRPLNKRGRHDAPMMAERLAERQLRPDLLLISPARRARATFEALAGQLPVDQAAVHFDERLYLAPLEELIKRVRVVADHHRHVMLVGHNPGLTEFANFLVDGHLENLPTCAAFSVELPDRSWHQLEQGSAKLLFYDYPKRNVT